MNPTIKLHQKTFARFIAHEEILNAIETIAQKMNRDFAKEKPLFLVVLKGAFMFAGELVKALDRDCDIEFIRLKSYEGTQSQGKVSGGLGDIEVKNRHIVIVEDIVDTGNTIEYLEEELKQKGAGRVQVATLFLKPDIYQKSRKIDYVGLEIPAEFVVGFGLDYDERGRGFRDLYREKVL